MNAKPKEMVIEHDLPPQSQAVTLAPDTGWLQEAITNPSTDVTKLERLEAMYERVTARSARAAFDAALADMQPELPVIERRGAIVIRDKNNEAVIKQSTPYALFEDINEAIRPMLQKHGFAVSFRTGLAADGKVSVTGILSHRGGHREETSMILPHDSTGSKNAVQAVGSSTSYGKRYVLCALLNITTRGEDDDGKAGGLDPISDEQDAQIRALITETKTNLNQFLKWVGAESVSDIPSGKFDEVLAKLNEKKAKMAKGGAA